MAGAAKKTASSRLATEGDTVTLTLAHPISRVQDKRYLGLDEDKDYEVGDDITVNKNGAMSLIGSGLVQVDPFDSEAVRKALGGDEPGAVDTTAAPASAGDPSN